MSLTPLRRILFLILTSSTGLLIFACSNEYSNDKSSGVSLSPEVANGAGMKYGGAVDTLTCDTLGGWVWNAGNPTEEIHVELLSDGKLLETAAANQNRPDLKNLGGTDHYGFSIKTPRSLMDNQPHTMSARVSGANVPIEVWSGLTGKLTCKPK